MASSDELIRDKLISMFPNFQAQWENEDNVWRGEDGSFTLWGLFSEFSHYVRGHFDQMPEPKRKELMDFIEACVTNDEDNLHNAVYTCFLENLAGEPSLSGQLRRYMGPKSEAFFNYWDVPDAV